MFVVFQPWLLKFIQKQPKVKIQRLLLHSPTLNVFFSLSKYFYSRPAGTENTLWSSLSTSRGTREIYELSVNEKEWILSSPKDYELSYWSQQMALLYLRSNSCKGHTHPIAQAWATTLAFGLQPSNGYSRRYHLESELVLSLPPLTVPIKHSETTASAALQEIFSTETALSLIFTKYKLVLNFYMTFLT